MRRDLNFEDVINLQGSASGYEQACDREVGIGTERGDIFEERNLHSVPDFAPGTCIKQTSNLVCLAIEEVKCARVGEDCEMRRSLPTGGTFALCRWSEVEREGDCPSPGIGTTAASTFAPSNPDSVPAGFDGACIREAQGNF